MIGFVSTHLTQFVLLTIIFVTGLMIFTDMVQMSSRLTLVVLMAVLYFLFGIIHHVQEKNLSNSLVLEYLVISLLLLWAMIALSF